MAVYSIIDPLSKTERLVSAPNRAQAVAHVVKGMEWTVKVCGVAEVVAKMSAGAKVEAAHDAPTDK